MSLLRRENPERLLEIGWLENFKAFGRRGWQILRFFGRSLGHKYGAGGVGWQKHGHYVVLVKTMTANQVFFVLIWRVIALLYTEYMFQVWYLQMNCTVNSTAMLIFDVLEYFNILWQLRIKFKLALNIYQAEWNMALKIAMWWLSGRSNAALPASTVKRLIIEQEPLKLVRQSKNRA